MRRWGLAIAVVVAIIVTGAPSAHASPNVPPTYGTATGSSDGDAGDCSGHYVLDGQFSFVDQPAVDTVATLDFSGRCPGVSADPMTGTIASPEFSGFCWVGLADISVAVNPFAGVPVGHELELQCTPTMANGDVAQLDVDVWLATGDTTGVFTQTWWTMTP